MTSSRKRRRASNGLGTDGTLPKKARRGPGDDASAPNSVTHVLLSQYYPDVLTLRQYVLSKLPPTSKIRRKKISAVGVDSPAGTGAETSDLERSVGTLLDTTLVGLAKETTCAPDNRWEQWTTFSQKGDESHVSLSGGLAGAAYSQPDIVDFVIWLLFSRAKTWPKHMLCDGFRRGNAPGLPVQKGANDIPGLYCVFRNHQVDALKQAPWPQLLNLLGRCGDRIMMDLLLDCALFICVNAGQGNYQQISGYPLSDAEVLPPDGGKSKPEAEFERPPTDIGFVRNRMLYARAALNARGLVHFGLRHIHVLNRAPRRQLDEVTGEDYERTTKQNQVNTLKILMYMFPRQFGLHNVFTSTVDFRETSQRLKDYTLREDEITKKFGPSPSGLSSPKVSVPKRLRGKTTELVQKLQILHARCSYSKLLEYYCPVTTLLETRESSQSSKDGDDRVSQGSDAKGIKHNLQFQSALNDPETSRSSSLMDLATPTAKVSVFCQAVVTKLIPKEFWGNEAVREHNQNSVLHKIHRFIHLRRFESMSLHEVMHGMKMTGIEWLAAPRLMAHKTSQTDMRKRAELLNEFLYYVFDSIVIPLLRSNFYVTESGAHKYRLFFFRHDVWRYVAEPAMAALKTKMFDEVSLGDAQRILESRRLGFSQVRLLPKEVGMRPIVNLRRRAVMRNSKKVLGPSINTILGPAHAMLQLEKSVDPAKLGAAMFSVGDIYQRIKSFKTKLGKSKKPLYFAKVDVQAAFDTIPQSAIVRLLGSIPQQRGYQIRKHVEVTNSKLAAGGRNSNKGKRGSAPRFKPTRKWHSKAVQTRDRSTFLEKLECHDAVAKRNTVFIESVVRRQYQAGDLLGIVASHIQQNLVKIGKKFYRQKQGIPQGSVLSSMLCNYFYADLERRVLMPFLGDAEEGEGEDYILLRLIDDFLLVTTDRAKAARFVETMHAGVPAYGVRVSPGKSLVNFDLTITTTAGGNGTPVPRLPAVSRAFPYCGLRIDCKSLDITRDRERTTGRMSSDDDNKDKNKKRRADRGADAALFNSLTVEYGRAPGHAFERKLLNAFKIQSHPMFFDTALNRGAPTVLANLAAAFAETAAKTWAYARCLPKSNPNPKSKSASASVARRPPPDLLVRGLRRLVDVAYLLLTSRARRLRHPDYRCDVAKAEVAWLAYAAFRRVLGRKQARYGAVLGWLDAEMGKLAALKDIRKGRVGRIDAGGKLR